MPIFNFHSAADVTPGRLKDGLFALRELVPPGYARRVRRAQDFQADRMEKYLVADIEETFSDKDVQNAVRSCGFMVPLVRKVIGQLSLLYKREPLRRLQPLGSKALTPIPSPNGRGVPGGRGEGEVSVAQRAERLYGEIAFQGNLSEALRRCLEWANLLRVAFVQVAVAADRIAFDPLSPADVLLAPPPDGRVGDLSRYEAVVVPRPYLAEGRRAYAFWSEALHFVFDEEGKIAQDFGDPSLANPLGVIPFVRVDREPASDLYPLPAESLVTANQRLNFAATELFYTKKFQSFGQPVFVTDDDVKPDLKVGVQHLVHVVKRDAAASGDFRFESPKAPIAEVKDSIFDFLRLLARLHDVSPQSVDISATVESGISRLLSERDATESRERDTALFRYVEDRLFELTCRVASVYADTNMGPAARYGADLKFLDSSRLGIQVRFPEAEPVVDPQARLQLRERELALGLKSIADVYREENPDAASWSEEEILTRIEENRRSNERLVGAGSAVPVSE